MHMENQYKRTTTTVSFINYHFVFCPRFRRKIFDIPGVEERFKELVSFIYKKNAILILAMEWTYLVLLWVRSVQSLELWKVRPVKSKSSSVISIVQSFSYILIDKKWQMEDHPRNSALNSLSSAGCQICGPEASLYPQLVTSAQKLYAGMSKHRKQGHKSFR